MQKDIYNKVKVTQILAPVSITATTSSAVYDATNDLGVAFFVEWGTMGNTLSATDYYVSTVKSSSTAGGTYTALTADELVVGPDDTASASFGLVNAPADDNAVYGIGVSDDQTDRFFKVYITLTGSNTSGTPVSVIAVSIPKDMPAGNTTTP